MRVSRYERENRKVLSRCLNTVYDNADIDKSKQCALQVITNANDYK